MEEEKEVKDLEKEAPSATARSCGTIFRVSPSPLSAVSLAVVV